MPLWIMRHPRVMLDEPTCYGASDVPIDTAHVNACADALADALPHGTPIIASERERTQVLARALTERRPDLAHWQVDARLNEMDFGCWELVPWRHIPKPAIDAWTADFPTHRFGGRESVMDVVRRTSAMLKAYQRSTPAPTQLWITHAGVLNALALLQRQPGGHIRSAAEWPSTAIHFGEWTSYPA